MSVPKSAPDAVADHEKNLLCEAEQMPAACAVREQRRVGRESVDGAMILERFDRICAANLVANKHGGTSGLCSFCLGQM